VPANATPPDSPPPPAAGQGACLCSLPLRAPHCPLPGGAIAEVFLTLPPGFYPGQMAEAGFRPPARKKPAASTG